jgi:hypothetical protein
LKKLSAFEQSKARAEREREEAGKRINITKIYKTKIKQRMKRAQNIKDNQWP